MLKTIVAALGFGAVVAAQTPRVMFDPDELTRLKDFSAERVSSNNPDPASNDDSWRPIAGETVVLADLTGPGVVTHIWLTVAANEYGWPRLLRLRAYYDDSPVPSVDCPVGDFFGVGHGFERSINSVMARNSSSGRSRNSYWPMPFARRLRLTITNEGRRRVANLYFHVDWKKVPALPPDTAYFHARYRQSLPASAGQPYEILSVNGRGHYVGTVLNVVQNQAGWFGEGDERFYVDGAAKPSIEGTGTEDYFNDAWSFRVADGLYTGVPVADGTGVGARMGAYRWHLADPIPFQRSLRLDIEHKGWTYNSEGAVKSAFEERPDLFSSVAFWYQAGIAADQPQVPYGSRRLPIGNARQIEVENSLAEAKSEGGAASVEKDVFWSKDILLFTAKGPGSKLTIPFDVADDGRYEIVAQVAHSADYGTYSTELDGKPTASAEALEHEPGANTGAAGSIDAYFPEIYVAEDHLIGWARLAKGRHTITFVCTGKNSASTGYNLGIDTLIVANLALPAADAAGERAGRIRSIGERRQQSAGDLDRVLAAGGDADAEVREAAIWSLGQLASATPQSIDALVRALSDADHVVRGLAAVALRDAGRTASPAREALLARLDDEDVGVRMMAAQAIGRLRDPSVIDRLIGACRVADQHVHVLRSLADALGDLGPQASRALPTLRELAKIPRVAWSADAAIRKITPP
jgi:hypothetical protein